MTTEEFKAVLDKCNLANETSVAKAKELLSKGFHIKKENSLIGFYIVTKTSLWSNGETTTLLSPIKKSFKKKD